VWRCLCCEEPDDHLVDLVGSLLLHPVATPREHLDAAEVRKAGFHRFEAAKQHGAVAAAAHEQGRLLDGRPLGNGEFVPVSVQVAVAAERAGKAGGPVFGGVAVHVGAGQPRQRQGGFRDVVEQALPWWLADVEVFDEAAGASPERP
jgi:hypothetical protein